MKHRSLKQLWRLADSYKRKRGETRDAVFDPIGLLLDRRLVRAAYDSTPANTRAFAWTGGDGVHFSFLVSDDGIVRDDCPVVMSVPMNSGTNVIVGENLEDFVSLGMRFGFFPLEQITYQPDAFFKEYRGKIVESDFIVDKEQAAMLARIAELFGAVPWRNPRARFKKLQALAVHLQPPPRRRHRRPRS